MRFTNNDIDDYRSRLTPDQKVVLLEHSNRLGIIPNICAWYDDLEDYYEAWEEVQYSEAQADELLHGDEGEFIIFDDGQIIRLAL